MDTRTYTPLGEAAEIVSAPSSSPFRTEKFVSFKLGDVSYAVLAAAVAEVTHPLPLTPLPKRVPGVLGISPLRGEILGVLDIRRMVGNATATSTDPKSKQIVLKRTCADAVPMAFTVDRIGEVVQIDLTQVRPAGEGSEYLIGETEVDGRVVKIIGHSKLSGAAEPNRPAPSI